MDQENANRSKNNFLIPVSIIIAGGVIAAALYFGGQDSGRPAASAGDSGNDGNAASLENVRPVGNEDHVFGNREAAVKIIEYSDLECPFCKQFHGTMKRIMEEYGEDGKVAWVYRHFPIDSLHSKARSEATAAECAAELGGNEAFWNYVDRFFELTPSNDRTDIETVLPQIAQEIGLDETKFSSCLESGKYDEHIEDDVQNAIATGGRGTPWSIVVAPNGKKFPLSGSQPFESARQLVELALQEK